MNNNNAQTIANVGSAVRMILLLVAGPLISKGVVDGATIDMVSGGIAVVLVGGWVVYKNWKTHQNTITVAAKSAAVAGASQPVIDQVAAAAKAGTL